MRSMLVLTLVLFSSLSAARAQLIEGRVTRLGFPASTASGAVIRDGQWFPILVQLRMPGTGIFEGALSVETIDLDGDRVEFIESPLVINSEAGVRRVWAYAVCQGNRGAIPGQTSVDVLGSNGGLVAQIPTPNAEFISSDAYLILDVSDQQVARFRVLEGTGGSPLEFAPGTQPYYRPVIVSFMPADELPDRWFGLEAVDVVVWDSPNPGTVSPAQIEALLEWVRRGGQLVIGIGGNWAVIAESPLAAIMPVAAGETVETNNLNIFFQRYAGDDGERSFGAPIRVHTGAAKRNATVLVRDETIPARRPIELVATSHHGSGRVTAIAASLRDLARVRVSPEFFAQFLDLAPRGRKYNDNEKNSFNQLAMTGESNRIFSAVVRPADFEAARTIFVIAAFLFVLAYGLVATFVSWTWLRRKGLLHLSWSVFAAFATAASAMSLAAVGLTRGLSRGVQSACVVNLEAGSAQGSAYAWFGYGSPVRQTVEVSLDGTGNYVRAMASGPRPSESYATPLRYMAEPRSGRLIDAPMRATLKQFEGAWSGDVGGVIHGQLVVDRATGRITPQSWIQNDLNVPITGGYLLFLDPRARPQQSITGALQRPFGAPEHWRHSGEVPAALNVLAVRIPSLRPAERNADSLGATEYADYERAFAAWSAQAQRTESNRPDLPTLLERQQQSWSRSWLALSLPTGGLSATAEAMMLASTRNLYLPLRTDKNFDDPGVPLSTDGVVNCDITHWLMADQAVLLLAAEDPGPVQLHIDGRPRRARSGTTLYRVRIPIQSVGVPPPRPTTAGEPS